LKIGQIQKNKEVSFMKKNINQKIENQKRIFIATVISFVFFIAYDMLVIQPSTIAKQEALQAQQTQQATQTTTQATTTASSVTPSVTTPAANKQAPVTQKQTVAQAPIAQNSIISTIQTANAKIEIDDLGRIVQMTLLEEIYKDEDGKNTKLFTGNESVKVLEVRFSDAALNDLAFKNKVTASVTNADASSNPATLTLTQNLGETTLTKTITFYPDNHYDVQVSTSTNTNFFVSPGFRPSAIADMYADHGVLLKMADNTLNIVEDEDLDFNKNMVGVKIASAFDRYYATLLYNMEKTFEITLMPTLNDEPQIFIHVQQAFDAKGYMGPKHYKTLEAIHPELVDAIEYGWFTFLAKPMFTFLMYLHGVFGNWGWAIVVITIIIKIVLYPLTYKGMVSMQKLKDLAPKIKQLQEKYKDQPQKMSAHMMELYKKHDANPMGGCLPMLLQIPVFFGIYRVLVNAIELKGAEWILWIDDLSKMDPYFVLPILMGATMYIQQKITPNTIQDEMQRKMFELLPVIFTFFFAIFPAGLTLYWFMNNLLTVGQQYYINKLFEKKKALFRH
jgi:YidC/Oxa1 family membrane protein insertase